MARLTCRALIPLVLLVHTLVIANASFFPHPRLPTPSQTVGVPNLLRNFNVSMAPWNPLATMNPLATGNPLWPGKPRNPLAPGNPLGMRNFLGEGKPGNALVIGNPLGPRSLAFGRTNNMVSQVERGRNKKGKMIREFLYEHNKVREQLNEPALVWDKQLARYADRYANIRKNDCSLIHSPGQTYGENLYCGQHFERHSASMAVRAWVSESQYFHPSTHSCDPSKDCGHYTQIVWRSSKRVGCSRVRCKNGGVFIICVYDPAGNFHNEDPLTSKD